MIGDELKDRMVGAIVIALLMLNPQEKEYYHTVFKHYQTELAKEQFEPELDKTRETASTHPIS
jgi:hypothetical protein